MNDLFTSRSINQEQSEQIEYIQQELQKLVDFIRSIEMNKRHQAITISRLEEAGMFAVKGVAFKK